MEGLSDVLDLDIREFLQNLILLKQKRNPRFSQRAFAHQLGFSPSSLNEIIKGKRGLSKKSREKLKAGLAGDKDFEQYLLEHRKDLIEMWHLRVFLELVGTEGFHEDLKWISRRLGVTEDQAAIMLDELLRDRKVQRNSAGKLVAVASRAFSPLAEVAPESEQKTQDEIAKLSQVVKEVPSQDCFFGTVVVAIDPKDFEYIRAKMVDVMKEHQSFLNRDGVKRQEVYQLSFGCVPLTKKVSGEA
ncbi:DUF4423 domain-containing protein [Bdellovibrio sp. 22V]|uniref:DUF4423 domain-containing protein n=1 Tax=Bdellovibrio TaxID=958 RepID=UPI0025430BF1|nr:DUF4423 domain-containing protein [Bdellovibrio sp. 22V]WII71551.1 DUF4423 domain-containing protein [Bdellovibrio sp. 22V]